jgi:hypothetical protein
LQSLFNHLGFQEKQMITSSWQGTETSYKEQWTLAGQTPLQMRTMTYNDEAAPGAGTSIS